MFTSCSTSPLWVDVMNSAGLRMHKYNAMKSVITCVSITITYITLLVGIPLMFMW